MKSLNVTKAGLVSLLIFLLGAACTRKDPHGQVLLEELQNYPLRTQSIEGALQARIEGLRNQRKDVQANWRIEKVNERSYNMHAEIGVGGKLVESYLWQLNQKLVPDHIRGEFWQVTKRNRAALKLME